MMLCQLNSLLWFFPTIIALCSIIKSSATQQLHQQMQHNSSVVAATTKAPNYLETSRQITNILDKFMSLGYDKRVRPNYGGPPVEVNVTMRILSISSVSEVMMDFTADFYFRQTWHDPRLAFKKLENIRTLYVGAEVSKKIWLPDTFFGNEKLAYFHEATTPNVFLRIDHSGEVYRSIRLTVTSSCPMNLQYFPMDRQRCTIEAESYGYNVKDIIYHWARKDTAVERDKEISLPQFDIVRTVQKYRLEELSSGTYSRLIAEIHFARRMGYYLIQIYIPSSLIVVISWVSFWLHRNASPARVQLGVTTVLTMTTLMSSTNAALPKISYVKSIDIFLGTCFVMVFAALLEYATVGYLGKRIAMRKAQLQHAQSQAQARLFALAQAQGAQGDPVPPVLPVDLAATASNHFNVAHSSGSPNLFGDTPTATTTTTMQQQPPPSMTTISVAPILNPINSINPASVAGAAFHLPHVTAQSHAIPCSLPQKHAHLHESDAPEPPPRGDRSAHHHHLHRHHHDHHSSGVNVKGTACCNHDVTKSTQCCSQCHATGTDMQISRTLPRHITFQQQQHHHHHHHCNADPAAVAADDDDDNETIPIAGCVTSANQSKCQQHDLIGDKSRLHNHHHDSQHHQHHGCSNCCHCNQSGPKLAAGCKCVQQPHKVAPTSCCCRVQQQKHQQVCQMNHHCNNHNHQGQRHQQTQHQHTPSTISGNDNTNANSPRLGSQAAATAAAATFVNIHRRNKGLPPSTNPNFANYLGSWMGFGATAAPGHVNRGVETIFGIRPSDIDKYSRVVFPVCFVCFQLMYWIVYLHISAFIEQGEVPTASELQQAAQLQQLAAQQQLVQLSNSTAPTIATTI